MFCNSVYSGRGVEIFKLYIGLFGSLFFAISSAESVELPKTANGVYFSLGIPYAEAPVGRLRWRPS